MRKVGVLTARVTPDLEALGISLAAARRFTALPQLREGIDWRSPKAGELQPGDRNPARPFLRISAHFDDVHAATTMPFVIKASRHDTKCFPLMSASLGEACFSARLARTDENAETSALENCQINYGQRSA